eukprot:6010977-Amphidinium_carterae.1
MGLLSFVLLFGRGSFSSRSRRCAHTQACFIEHFYAVGHLTYLWQKHAALVLAFAVASPCSFLMASASKEAKLSQ